VAVSGLVADKWQFGAATFSGSSERTVYLDGSSATSTTAHGGDTLGGWTHWAIGQHAQGMGSRFSGDIALSAMWNKRLTAGW